MNKAISPVIAAILMIIVVVVLVIILYGVATGLLFTAQSSVSQSASGMTGDVATCRIEAADSTTDTITVRQTNDIADAEVDSVYINGSRTSCTGPSLTYDEATEIDALNCGGLAFDKNDNILVTGKKSMSCSGSSI